MRYDKIVGFMLVLSQLFWSLSSYGQDNLRPNPISERIKGPQADLEGHLRRPDVTGKGGRGIRGRFLKGPGQTYDAIIIDGFPYRLLPNLEHGLSAVLAQFDAEGKFLWADLATGLGTAPKEALTLCKNLSTFLVDRIRWTQSDLQPDVAQDLEIEASRRGIPNLWTMEGMNFVEADISSITIPSAVQVGPNESSPLRIVTMLQALSYNSNPLEILVEVYNQLPVNAYLVVNFYIPTGYDAKALGIPPEYDQPEKLVAFWESQIFPALNRLGIETDLRVKDHRIEGEPEQGYPLGNFPEFHLGMVIKKAPGSLRLQLNHYAKEVKVHTIRDVIYTLAWYEGNFAQPFAYEPRNPSPVTSQRPVEVLCNI